MDSVLKIAICQCDIVWEDSAENRSRISCATDFFLRKSAVGADVILLPEFFTTGFTMNPGMAETEQGETLSWMKTLSSKHHVTLVGSIPVREGDRIFNRQYFVCPDGSLRHYDKRHLFRMSDENRIFAPGSERVVVEYKGWRIALNTCYDLRFPVWSRNAGEYDLMLNVASWPASRIGAAQTLVRARAIENQCYYAFANRIGDSPSDSYSGGSMIVDYKGEDCEVERLGYESASGDTWTFITACPDMQSLQRFRGKFPAWMDADTFELNIT